jgi:hypothetical protein
MILYIRDFPLDQYFVFSAFHMGRMPCSSIDNSIWARVVATLSE